MKALVFNNNLYIDKDYPKPVPGEDEALIKSRPPAGLGKHYKIER